MTVSPSAPATLARIARSVPGRLHDLVGGLHHGDCAPAGCEAELIRRLPGYQGHEPMWTCLHLDLRHDAVLDDARDDAGEMVAGGSADGSFGPDLSGRSGHEARQLAPIHGTLAPPRPARRQTPTTGQPSNAVDADAEKLGNLPHLVRGHGLSG